MITVPDAPDDDGVALNDAISHLMYNGPFALPPKGGGAQNQDGAQRAHPLRVFSLDLDRIRNADFLSNAAPQGWRYIIHSSEPVAIADMRADQAGGAAFSRLIRGPLAFKISEAADQAEHKYGDDKERSYEARILEIPSLYIIALWLHGKDEVFFSISNSKGMSGGEISGRAFVEEVLSQARQANRSFKE